MAQHLGISKNTVRRALASDGAGRSSGMTILKGRICELRPTHAPIDLVSRTVYRPGELSQCDLWLTDAHSPRHGQPGRPPMLVMVSATCR